MKLIDRIALAILLLVCAACAPHQPAGNFAGGHPPGHGPVSGASSETRGCSVPGSVFVREVGGCVRHVTDRAEIAKAIKPELADDERCRNQPDGTRYDTPVVGPNGAKGVAHHVCGMRQPISLLEGRYADGPPPNTGYLEQP